MTATPADIAKFTTDGVVVTSPVDQAVSDAIKAAHIDAQDGSSREIEMFFVDPAVAQAFLDERFTYQRMVGPVHVGVEVEQSLGLGITVPLVPTVPCFTVIDPERDIVQLVRTRAYAADNGSDRYSAELQE